MLFPIRPHEVFAAEQADMERVLRKITPSPVIAEDIIAKKDSWYFDCFYEPSVIIQGNRTGRWSEITHTFGYTHKNIQGYFSISQLDRMGNDDYTANFGAYISLENSYIHFEPGFGWDVDYIYDFQNIIEYGHKLYKTLFWQMGYNYRSYRKSGNTHLAYPSLIYYFGDNYIGATCGVSYIEGRDNASFGNIRGNFKITESLSLYGGVAFGERLYDIFPRKSNKESGFILFGGATLNVYKGITARVGYTYGTEAPKFQKHGVHYGVMAKF
ncbi:MAG: hypothetical protein PHS46_00625 [Candidatus Omnitrophica bacterium]|nr:hypothetical protein [Candidatus Omnitrophota bacterium]